jgi:hypothetical protein
MSRDSTALAPTKQPLPNFTLPHKTALKAILRKKDISFYLVFMKLARVILVEAFAL